MTIFIVCFKTTFLDKIYKSRNQMSTKMILILYDSKFKQVEKGNKSH